MTKEELDKLKVNQIKSLDIYHDMAKNDDTFRKFLVTMATRLNGILHQLDADDKAKQKNKKKK